MGHRRPDGRARARSAVKVGEVEITVLTIGVGSRLELGARLEPE